MTVNIAITLTKRHFINSILSSLCLCYKDQKVQETRVLSLLVIKLFLHTIFNVHLARIELNLFNIYHSISIL